MPNPTLQSVKNAAAGSCVALVALLVFALPAAAQRDKKSPAAPTAAPQAAKPEAGAGAPAADEKPQADQPKQAGQGGGPGGGGFGGGAGGGGGRRGGRGGGGGGEGAKPEKTAYDYYLPGPDGKNVPLADFKGKYIMVVNLGRKSGYSAQLPGLIKLYDTYKDKGFVVIGVPSNEFGAAEPGTEDEIQKSYIAAKVDFPVMAVSKITGDDQLPFYGYLTKAAAPLGGDIVWNYTKIILDQKGNVIARLDPDVAPDSVEMLATIDEILEGTYKPKGGAPTRGGRGGGGGGGAAPAEN